MKKRKFVDLFFSKLVLFSSLLVVLIFVLLFAVLYGESRLAIEKFGFWKFVFSTSWNPPKEIFGGAPAIVGTLISSAIAIYLAVPIALGIAIFLTEVAPHSIREVVKTAVELLAVIPSII